MLPRPPRSTLFPYTRSSDLEDTAVGAAPHEEAAAPLRLRGLDAQGVVAAREVDVAPATLVVVVKARDVRRSEEHTSELQSPMYLVCRLLLEKKKRDRRGAP